MQYMSLFLATTRASSQRPFPANVFDDTTCRHDTGHKGVQGLRLEHSPRRHIVNDTTRQVYFHLLPTGAAQHCLLTDKYRQADINSIAVEDAGETARNDDVNTARL